MKKITRTVIATTVAAITIPLGLALMILMVLIAGARFWAQIFLEDIDRLGK